MEKINLRISNPKFLFLNQFNRFASASAQEFYAELLRVILWTAYSNLSCMTAFIWMKRVIRCWAEKNIISQEQQNSFLLRLTDFKSSFEGDHSQIIDSVSKCICTSDNYNEISILEVSKLFEINILLKDTTCPNKIRVYQRLDCPIKIYILKDLDQFIFLFPKYKNPDWGFIDCLKIHRSSELSPDWYTDRDISLEDQCMHHNQARTVVTCAKGHKQCLDCLRMSKDYLQCPQCLGYDFNIIIPSIFWEKARKFKKVCHNPLEQVNRYLESEISNMSSMDACTHCKQHMPKKNGYCYYCILYFKIVKQPAFTEYVGVYSNQVQRVLTNRN